MFRKTPEQPSQITQPIERVTSVLGPGINWTGSLRGSGGIRIEGNFEGDVLLNGLLVIGETGKVTCQNLRANNVVVAGLVKGNITAEKLEIRSTGRVWGDVVVTAFATEEGAFLRGQVRMEEHLELGLDAAQEKTGNGITESGEEQTLPIPIKETKKTSKKK
jgi:cytoskeletal protein CcmA (bactofilin family)